MRWEHAKRFNLRELSKTFGRRRHRVKAVRDINLDVAANQVYGFLGPNGAGKSTTIRMILDLIRPSHGEVQLFGQPIKQNRAILQQRVGGMVEGAMFYPFLTGKRNLQVIARTGGFYDEKRIDRLLEQVNLHDRAESACERIFHGHETAAGVGPQRC